MNSACFTAKEQGYGMHEMHVCAGLSGEFRAGQVAALVLIWSGAFLLACFAPLHLYGSVRCALCYFFPQWSSVTAFSCKAEWPLNKVALPRKRYVDCYRELFAHPHAGATSS